MSKTTEIKKKCRSELDPKSWGKGEFSNYSFWPDLKDLTPIIQINYNTVTELEFRKRIEEKCIPCIIKDVMSNWPANEKWDLERLKQDYRNELFKVGEDDNGKVVYVSMKRYIRYLKSSDSIIDDSPLYIFDSAFASRTTNNSSKSKSKTSIIVSTSLPSKKRKNHSLNTPKKEKTINHSLESTNTLLSKTPSYPTSCLLNDYHVPKYFSDDLFKWTGTKKRPPYRWLVIGPSRSGTGIHIDPLGTSAWNALVSGHKRWVLFPPKTPLDLIKPKGLSDNEAVTWFAKVFNKFTQVELRSTQTLGEILGMIHVIQGPGDIMVVPGGWHHIVINLDMTVAITQNYCSRANIEYVWLKTRFARPKLSRMWLKRLVSKSREFSDDAWVFKEIVGRIESLETVPPLYTSSSDDSSSSSDNESDF